MGKALIITTGGGTDIEEGNPNATPQYVLSGYTFYAARDDPQTGTMQTRWPELTHKMDPGWYLDLLEGYYTGKLICEAKPLNSFTGATATAAQVLKDKTGWRGGVKQIGTMVSRGATNGTISANGTYTVPVGWHNGSGKVTQSLSTQAATNVTPGTAQKTVIAASKWSSGNQTVLGNGNLVAGNIKKDITIFGVRGTYEFTGWTGPTDWFPVTDVFREVHIGNYTYTGWARYSVCNIPFMGLYPSYVEISPNSIYDSRHWGIILGPDANKYPNWQIYPSSSKGFLKNYMNTDLVQWVTNTGSESRFIPCMVRPLTEHLVDATHDSTRADLNLINGGKTHAVHALWKVYQTGINMNYWRTPGKNQGGRLWLSSKCANLYGKDLTAWTGTDQGIPLTHIRMIFCDAGSAHETTINLPSAFNMRFVPGNLQLS